MTPIDLSQFEGMTPGSYALTISADSPNIHPCNTHARSADGLVKRKRGSEPTATHVLPAQRRDGAKVTRKKESFKKSDGLREEFSGSRIFCLFATEQNAETIQKRIANSRPLASSGCVAARSRRLNFGQYGRVTAASAVTAESMFYAQGSAGLVLVDSITSYPDARAESTRRLTLSFAAKSAIRSKALWLVLPKPQS